MNNIPTQTVFYSIEKTIKEYRRFAQKNISKKFKDITVDQALVLLFLHDQPDLSQIELAKLIFKDNASVTRMIELMVKKNYLNRLINNLDRRKFKIEVTSKGKKIIKGLSETVSTNREKVLKGISKKELDQLENTLNKIITNCKEQ